MDKIKLLVAEKCFPGFSTIIDTTPTYAEHFCIVIRVVDKEWNIIEVMLRCCPYDSSFNADRLCHVILETLEDMYGFVVTNWRAQMNDRCAVNTSALCKIKQQCLGVCPTEIPCTSH